MKHARKTVAALALFALAPLVGCDQGGQVEDASAPDTATTPDTTRQPPPRDTPPPPPEEPGIDDPSGG